MSEESLVFRLRERARIRRQIPTRKSVLLGQPDRLADLLEEAADEIERLEHHIDYLNGRRPCKHGVFKDYFCVSCAKEYRNNVTEKQADYFLREILGDFE